MNAKGIVISIDALIALMLILVIFTLSAIYLGEVNFVAKNSLILKENAMDAITIIEKNLELEKAVKNNDIRGLRKFANSLPNNLCIDLDIYSENDLSNAVLSLLKPGCKKNFIDSATFNRSFIVRDNLQTDFYLAKITIWNKVTT